MNARHCEARRDEAIHLDAEYDTDMDYRVGLRPSRNDEVVSIRSEAILHRACAFGGT